MANESITLIDQYGRLVVPKSIRDKFETKQVVLIYDEKNKDAHIIPVKNISEWKGKFKGILKNYMKEHEEDQNDTHRR
ncbi:MAG: hypothetical protein AABX38_02455 [Candidatus Micrarchaeota archaeon]